jgi:AAA15 family ATPase/GTPase
MKIRKLKLKNVLTYDDLELEFTNINFIMGVNNSGKTNLLRALDLLIRFINPDDHIYSDDEIFKDITRFHDLTNEMSIIATFELNDSEMNIIKDILIILGGSGREDVPHDKKEIFRTSWGRAINKVFTKIFNNSTLEITLKYNGSTDSYPETIYKIGKIQLDRFGNTVVEPIIKKDSNLTITNLFLNRKDNPKDLNEKDVEKRICKALLSGDSISLSKDFHRLFDEDKPKLQRLFNEIINNSDIVFRKGTLNLKYFIELIVANKFHISSHSIGYDEFDWGISKLAKIFHKASCHEDLSVRKQFKDVQKEIKNKTLFELEPILKPMKKNKEVYNKNNEVPELIEEIVKVPKLKVISTIKSDFQTDLSYMGAGMIEIIRSLVGMMSGYKIFCLDEPAQNLHPNWQRLILTSILKHCRNDIQVILITHSPYMLPDFYEIGLSKNSKINLYYFHLNENKMTTQIQMLDFDFDPKLRKHIKTINSRKKLFFTNTPIIVEGPQDEIIFSKIVENTGLQDEMYSRNTDFINCIGSSTIFVYLIFIKWKIPVKLIIDYDLLSNFLKIGDYKIEKDSNVLILPSTIEGLIILGNFLFHLKSMLEKNKIKYVPSDIIYKFDKCDKKDLLKLEKLFKNYLTNKSLETLKKLIKVLVKNSIDISDNNLKKYVAKLNEPARISNKKLNYFLNTNQILFNSDLKIFELLGSKMDFSREIIEHEVFFQDIPKEIINYLKS